MNRNKLDYESPHYEIVIEDLEDVITESKPDFDGGQSGLNHHKW